MQEYMEEHLTDQETTANTDDVNTDFEEWWSTMEQFMESHLGDLDNET
jgi:hypothetical protein